MKALDFRVVPEWLPNPLCSHGRPPLLRSRLRERCLWPQKETGWSQLRRLSEAPPLSGAGIFDPLLANHPVTFDTQLIDP